MVKEPKNIDFYTTGRQPSDKEFALISEWIKKRKKKTKNRSLRSSKKKQKN
jgi:Zn-dependent M16 (insulinase) family peptidase